MSCSPRFDKEKAAKEELEKLLNIAVQEYEEEFALKEQKEEAAKAGEGIAQGLRDQRERAYSRGPTTPTPDGLQGRTSRSSGTRRGRPTS
jgi:hypothetical protein